MKNVFIAISGMIFLVVSATVAWSQITRLLPNDVVDETLPGQIPSAQELARMSPEELKAAAAEAVQAAANRPDKVMDEPMPETGAEPTAMVQGQFQDADSVHQGRGQATIYQFPDDSRVLRFEDFEVTKGPDLHVLLVEHPAPAGQEDINPGYLDLGPLKGNIGSQNYNIPAKTDLSQYQTVVIYCRPFHVIFAIAPLN